jgi:glycosyltransferase involved in cell wall biosynthesis
MKLSVIIPVYNEESTIKEIIQRVIKIKIRKEIIVVNDASNDKTGELLKKMKNNSDFVILHHQKNLGKGAAIQTALRFVRGDIVIIQDADLEYNPKDYLKLIEPIVKGRTKSVYGSRNFLSHPLPYQRYFWGRKFLTWLTNILYKSHLTDVNTGYKVFKTEVIKDLHLERGGFEFCEEVTAKVFKKGYSILEIPIKYYPRTFSKGKKIRVRDGLIAMFTLIKYKFFSRY